MPCSCEGLAMRGKSSKKDTIHKQGGRSRRQSFVQERDALSER